MACAIDLYFISPECVLGCKTSCDEAQKKEFPPKPLMKNPSKGKMQKHSLGEMSNFILLYVNRKENITQEGARPESPKHYIKTTSVCAGRKNCWQYRLKILIQKIEARSTNHHIVSLLTIN